MPSGTGSRYSFSLAEHEDRAHHQREREPAAQLVDVAALGGEHADLAGHRVQHQDRGEDQRVRDVELELLRRPVVRAGHRPDREVHGEQRREEHQLGGQPDDGPDRRPCSVASGSRAPGPSPARMQSPRRQSCQAGGPSTTRGRGRAGRRRVTPTRAGACRTAGPLVLADDAAHGGLPGFGPLSVLTADPRSSSSRCSLVAARRRPYLFGVRRLRRRGDRWPVGRTVSFVGLGLGTVLVATTSGLAAYDNDLFAAHMVQHMLLSMVASVFLALGAPVTLALRTLPRAPRPACWRCCTAAWSRCSRSRWCRGCCSSAAPSRCTSPAGTTATLRSHLAARAAARALPGRRVRCSSGRCWASTRCPGGSATPCGCCSRPRRCPSTPSSASRS